MSYPHHEMMGALDSTLQFWRSRRFPHTGLPSSYFAFTS